MSLPKVILTSQPATEGVPSPREQLSNEVARISQLQRKTMQVNRSNVGIIQSVLQHTQSSVLSIT